MENLNEHGQFDLKRTLVRLIHPRNWFSFEGIMKNLGFILFLFFLGIAYIWNRHSAEKIVIENNRIQQEMVEFMWEYTSKKAELANSTKQSEVAQSVKGLGLVELENPPKKLMVGDGH